MTQVRIAVCVVTRNRPEGLKRTLAAVARQQFRPQDVLPQVRVVVIDNDENGSAASVCDTVREGYPWPLVYDRERRVGLSFARNRALEIGCTDDFIAFVDDDEIPTDNWLSELLNAQRLYDADVVFGPVITTFTEPVPMWMSELFISPRKSTGTACSTGPTGNVLLAATMVTEGRLRFDNTFAFSGSEDYDFFSRAQRAGYRQVWSDEAIVIEYYPRSRTTIKWYLKRHFRYGSTEISLREVNTAPKRILEAIVASARIIFGIAYALILMPLGRSYSIRGLRYASFGLGLLYGLTGRRFAEYRTIYTG